MEGWGAIILVVGFGVYYAAATIATMRHVSARRRQLREFAEEAGLEEIRAFSDTNDVHGSWGRYTVHVSWEKEPRPERLILTIPVRPGPRLIVSPGGGGMIFVSRLPLVEVSHPAASRFVVRSDTPRIADMLFGDDELVRLLLLTVVAPSDRLELSERGLQINCGAPGPDLRRVADAGWALATRVVEVLPLGPP